MKNKKIMLIFILIVSLIVGSIKIVYAFSENSSQNDIFCITNAEVSKNQNVELVVDLDKIEYENYKIKLTSNLNINNMQVNNNNQPNINLNEEKNEIEIDINKTNTNLTQINLSYKIPNTVNIQDKISFKIIIINNNIIEGQEQEKIEIQKEVVIVEKQEEKIDNKENNTDIQEKENKNQLKSTTGTSYYKQSSIATKINNTQIIKFKGSCNNYLSKLKINGYNLVPDFSKDNTTYFITVGSTVRSLDIKTTAENENSKVNVYGNTNIESNKENKILITVTAENGNVKNYRVYVTKK